MAGRNSVMGKVSIACCVHVQAQSTVLKVEQEVV